MTATKSRLRQRVILLSPFGVIAIGHLTARIAGIIWGAWAWIPLALVLWGLFALLIGWVGGKESIGFWLRRPQGSWGWSALAVIVGLIPLPLFLMNWHLLSPISVWLPWLVFALINPWLEEGYWRGLLLDATSEWPGWLSVLYSSLLFATNHPLSWGVHSIANRHPVTFISTFIMGVVWSIVYRKTNSLRFAVLGHILVDLFNLTVPVFLNLYVPSELPIR